MPEARSATQLHALCGQIGQHLLGPGLHFAILQRALGMLPDQRDGQAVGARRRTLATIDIEGLQVEQVLAQLLDQVPAPRQ